MTERSEGREGVPIRLGMTERMCLTDCVTHGLCGDNGGKAA